MTREEAVNTLGNFKRYISGGGVTDLKANEAIDMAIEALKAQEWDEVVFDTNEFFSIVDDGKITVMRRGRGRVTVERPAMGVETTIFPYGEERE